MKKTIDVNKKKLELERSNLLSRLEKLSGVKTEADISEPKWVDYGQKSDENAAEVSDYADAASVQKSLQDRLSQIEEALLAMKAGTYGICKECGKPIEKDRLEAMPTATICLRHKP